MQHVAKCNTIEKNKMSKASLGTLTKKQFIDLIVNNTDNKSVEEMAALVGVSTRQFYRYEREFKLTSKVELKEIAQRYSMEQIANLRRMAANPKGDSRAAAILLQIAELYEPRSKQVQRQQQINFYISGLNVPKNAGLSDADPEAIPERTGMPVEISDGDFKVVSEDQVEAQVDDSQDIEIDQELQPAEDDSLVDEESEKGW